MARAKSPCGCFTEARLLILISLVETPRTGYAMIKYAKEEGNSMFRLPNGTLYGALRELKTNGLIEPMNHQPPKTSKRRTQPYALAKVGRTRLAEEIRKLRWLVKLADELGI